MSDSIREEPRVLVWFSCGAASAVASKIMLKKYGDRAEIVYCDTSSDEHPDNLRFLAECEEWFGREAVRLKSEEYQDRWDVYEKTGFLIGKRGARCTTELKINLRKAYQRVDDIHVFGYTVEEKSRRENLIERNPDLFVEFPLIENHIRKQDCLAMLADAGIELPAMYRLGYRNNNCRGCVKATQIGYWNKIRRDFPDDFWRMAEVELKIGHACIRKEIAPKKDGTRRMVPVFLKWLDPSLGADDPEIDLTCDILCQANAQELL